jgi:hypothetical protein
MKQADGSTGGQQGRCGQFWLLGSAVLLIVVGIAAAAGAMGARSVVGDAFVTACDAMEDAVGCIGGPCIDGCDNAAASELANLTPDEQAAAKAGIDATKQTCYDACKGQGTLFNHDQCMVDLYIEMECRCSGTAGSMKPSDCDCSGTGIQAIKDAWELACLALGLLALVGTILFTGLPGLISGVKSVPCCNVTLFSVCSGIWSLLFMAFGAGFIAVGMATQTAEFKAEIDKCKAEVAGAMPLAVCCCRDVCCSGMCVVVGIYVYICIYMYTHTHTHTHTHTNKHVRARARTHTHHAQWRQTQHAKR